MNNSELYNICQTVCKIEAANDIEFYDFHWQAFEGKVDINLTKETSFIDSLPNLIENAIEWSIPFIISKTIKTILKVYNLFRNRKNFTKDDIKNEIKKYLNDSKKEFNEKSIDAISDWIANKL